MGTSKTTSPAPEVVEELRDFRNFLFLVWKYLHLPEPTMCQYDIAEFLQHGPRRRIVQAFRGVGKSWITAAFVVWRLYLDPNIRIMVLSANEDRATDFTRFCLALIHGMDFLEHLRPENNKTQPLSSALKFNVGPARPDQAPSVRSKPILGMITGGRADVLVLDDVEIPRNSDTEGKREKLARAVAECGGAILKPNGEVVILGTPQCEQSVYTGLESRGYTTMILPVRYPMESEEAFYGNRLPERIIREMYTDPSLRGQPIEPSRFHEGELAERELEYGRSGFQLQFMLDTRLSDELRYPLKVRDLIVMDCDPNLAPEQPLWSNDPDNEWPDDIPNMAMDRDRFHRPLRLVGEHIKYSEKIMMIDPSGRGKDETVWGVLGFLNGYVYLIDAEASRKGYEGDTLEAVADMAEKYKVNRIFYENNFGDGMFGQLLQPIVRKKHRCTIEELRAVSMKEARIIDTLEPVMNQHKLVVSPRVIKWDYQSVQDYDKNRAHQYSLIHQMTRISKDRGCLGQDDRLDFLAWGVHVFLERMHKDAQKAMKKRQEAETKKELKKFLTVGMRQHRDPKVSHKRRRTATMVNRKAFRGRRSDPR